jgi:hypothetical protein
VATTAPSRRVAVERDADVTLFANHRLANQIEMHRAAFVIDVDAVGIDADRHHLGAELFENLGADLVARAVGAIDRDAHRFEARGARHAGLQKNQVASDRVVDARGLADVAVRCAPVRQCAVVENQLLDFRLELVVELEAVAREKLDAVVLERIVRRGNHHARIRTHTSSKKSYTRCRQRADQPYVDAHRTDSRGDRGFEHVARQARVLADENLAMASMRAAKDVRERAPQLHRGLRGNRLFVRDPAHAVGAEQLTTYAHRADSVARGKDAI